MGSGKSTNLGQKIEWNKWVYNATISYPLVSWGNMLDQIYEIRELQLKPGVINALAKLNQT